MLPSMWPLQLTHIQVHIYPAKIGMIFGAHVFSFTSEMSQEYIPPSDDDDTNGSEFFTIFNKSNNIT